MIERKLTDFKPKIWHTLQTLGEMPPIGLPPEPTEDAFAQHEVLDRAAILSSDWDCRIEDHPYVADNDKLAALAKQIGELMGDFYQAVGASHRTE